MPDATSTPVDGSTSCSASHSFTQAELDAGKAGNQAVGTCDNGLCNVVMASTNDADTLAGSPSAGEIVTCTADGKAIDGQYENLGIVTGMPPLGESVSDADLSHYPGLFDVDMISMTDLKHLENTLALAECTRFHRMHIVLEKRTVWYNPDKIIHNIRKSLKCRLNSTIEGQSRAS